MFFFMAICMKKVSNICNGNKNMLVSKLRERERERGWWVQFKLDDGAWDIYVNEGKGGHMVGER
jgi:hypothetical protein